MEYLIPILIIFALVLLNALFVAAEFAIIGAPRAAIDHLAAEGSPTAKTVQKILADPQRQDRFIATAQLGITVASLGLGMYGEHAVAEWIEVWLEGFKYQWLAAHSVASVVAIAILTYFHIVLGEMVPKSLALLHADKTALWIARPMLAFQALAYPLVIALNGVGVGILRLCGVRREAGAGLTSSDLEFVVQESREGGLLRAESSKVLQEVFDFGELDAGEIMVPRVRLTGLPVGADTELLKITLKEGRHTRYPVYEGDLDHILGVVHIKDLLRILMEGRTLARTEARPTAYRPETATLESILNDMRRERTQMIVVMDEHGGTAGMVSIEDLCDEVVGVIEEGGEDTPELYRVWTGLLRAQGHLRLEEVGEMLGLEIEHEEVDTVSGLILSLLERPPAVGDVVEYGGARFEVTKIEGHGVAECVVATLAENETLDAD